MQFGGFNNPQLILNTTCQDQDNDLILIFLVLYCNEALNNIIRQQK